MTEKQPEELTYEQATTRLEQIVAALEGGRCTLDESLGLFEEGAALTARCTHLLDEAEQKIVRLTALEAGEDGTELTDRPGEDMGALLSGD